MFDTEKQLVETIKENYTHLLDKMDALDRRRKYHILEELDLGHGIADIVFAPKPSNTKSIGRKRPLSYSDIFIYALLEKESVGMCFESIKNRTKISDKQLSKILFNLMDEKIIEIVGDQFLIGNKKLANADSIAIEAKLKDWKRALKQAYRYKWFATYSYVFMDSKFVGPALKNKATFKKYNIGLASVSTDGAIDILLKPMKIEPYDDVMRMLLGEYLLFGFKEGLPGS